MRGTGDELCVCVWVDHMLYWGRQESFVEWFERKVKEQFEVSDCSSLHWFLGMKIDVRETEIAVNQEKYIDDLLKRFNMEEFKPVESPIPENTKFERESIKEQDYDEQSTMERRDYRGLVGSLNYLALNCRPDIAHASHVLSRFLEHPSKEHWMAAKRILRYSKGTKQHELVFRMCEGGVTVCAFSDADWAGELTSRKSTSGVSGCVCWTSKFQASVALSTVEAEVNACTVALQELEYVCGVLSELAVVVARPVSVFVDNQVCIALSKHSINHNKTKHFAIKTCFLQEKTEKGEISLEFVPTDIMPADLLTKPLGKTKTELFTKILLCPGYSTEKGGVSTYDSSIDFLH